MAQKKESSKFGRIAESFAASYLSSKGYKIVDRNFRSKFGEIDIIATKDNNLVFVEVKARTNNLFGLPEESVTQSKLKKIIKTAEYYFFIHPKLPKTQRIEVVSLIIEEGRVKDCKIIPVD